MGIFHIGEGWGVGFMNTWTEFKASHAVLGLSGDALIQMAGAVSCRTVEPHDGETFSANIPVLINCFRSVTCILPVAVGLFKIKTVILKL